MIDVVRYDGLLDLSLSRDYRRKYAPYILHSLILIAPVVRYDGLLDLSLSRDYRRKYAPYWFVSANLVY